MKLPLVVRVGTLLSQFGVPRAAAGPTDDMGRSLWSVGAPGTLAPDSAASFSTRISLDECTTLGGTARYGRLRDARLDDSPIAGLAGPKILGVQVSVFEGTAGRKRR